MKYTLRKTVGSVIAATGLLLGSAMSAHAALITDNLTGDVDFASPNPWGISLATTPTMTITYEENDITGSGTETINIGDNNPAGEGISADIGSLSFDESMDSRPGRPELTFQDGTLAGVDWIAEFSSFGTNADFIVTLTNTGNSLEWQIYSAGYNTLYANGNFSLPNPPQAGVPEPMTLALFGAGLGLIGVRRRMSR